MRKFYINSIRDFCRKFFINSVDFLKANIITLHKFYESFSFVKRGEMIFGKAFRHVPKFFSLYHLLRHTVCKTTEKQHRTPTYIQKRTLLKIIINMLVNRGWINGYSTEISFTHTDVKIIFDAIWVIFGEGKQK